MKIIFLPALIALIAIAACNNQSKITSDKMDLNELQGTWELDYISGPRIAFDGLYPDKKPSISFNVKDKKVSGNSSCNSYSGPFTMEGFNVDFNGPIVSTKMACQGEGESVYFNTLKKITRYAITDSITLNLFMGDVSLMRFHKIPTP
ncbi:MAG: META domain-containing protein [Chitinophagaceae bacterium]|nr:MAG: META domain-containing protein [Chitinophagaceae bacterium]